MFYLLFMFMIYFLISMLILKISIFLSMKLKLNFEKMSPFECGFNPIMFKRMSFSIRFFMITIIFLIFDIEIALIMPMILSMNFSNMMIWTLTNLMFLLILIFGLIYEWNYGALNWM